MPWPPVTSAIRWLAEFDHITAAPMSKLRLLSFIQPPSDQSCLAYQVPIGLSLL